MKYLKDKYSKILEVKQYAKSKNVSWFQTVYFAVFVILAVIIPLTVIILWLVGTVSNELGMENNAILWGIMTYQIPIEFALLIWFGLIPILKMNVWVLDKVNSLIQKFLAKTLIKGIDKLDMYWFRKYRTHSPVTRMLDGIQSKTDEKKKKWSKKRKRYIKIGLIVAVILLQLYLRYPAIEEIYQETLINFDEMELDEITRDVGKIKSPLSDNPLLVEQEQQGEPET